MQRTLLWSYYICALLGLGGSGYLAMAMTAVAADSPNTPIEQAYIFGVVVFIIAALLTAITPLIAAAQVKYKRGMLFPMIYCLILCAFIPVGPIVGIAQAVMAWKLHRPPRPAAE